MGAFRFVWRRWKCSVNGGLTVVGAADWLVNKGGRGVRWCGICCVLGCSRTKKQELGLEKEQKDMCGLFHSVAHGQDGLYIPSTSKPPAPTYDECLGTGERSEGCVMVLAWPVGC